MRMTTWHLVCDNCDHTTKILCWDYELPQPCQLCEQGELAPAVSRQVHGIIGDDIPGGLEIRHLDAQPRKYYSKTEIKRACNERGVIWSDDTPKPYKVAWSGKQREPEKVKPMVTPSED